MAEIEMQDPLSTEIKSSTVAGIIEALNRISSGLEMSSESLTKESMTPVLGLDPEDPRRIYQVSDGKRIWISSPEPKIYVNNSQITSSDKDFTIDFIGGSITFEGEYRPEENDVVTVSCDHIYAAPQSSGGCEIIITFSSAFTGRAYSVTSKKGEVYTGNVPSSLVETVRVKYTSTEYTISSSDTAGKQHSTTVTTGEYYGQVEASLTTFSATVAVNTEPTASITVTGSGATYYGTADDYGKAYIIVSEEGEHSVTSTYKNANSNTKTINATSSGETYNTTLEFITLTVTIDAGSTVTVKNGGTTLTETATDGTAKFWLPNTGAWDVTATLSEQSTNESVQCSAYQDYSVELGYTLEATAWSKIHDISASGQAQNYYEIGDEKTIVLNGTVAGLSLNNLSISAFIIGFNHNSSVEGNNKIHFAIGKISDKMVALCNGYYSMDGSGFCMNKTDTNDGGWKDSYMRTNTLGNSGTPSSPASNSLMASMPSDLRSIMQPVTKYTNNHGGGYYGDYVDGTSDYMWLLSEFEVFGTTENSDSDEEGKQSQYAYFKNGNSKIAYNHTSMGTPVICWLRSVDEDYGTKFCEINTSGSSSTGFASVSLGILPCFAI